MCGEPGGGSKERACADNTGGGGGGLLLQSERARVGEKRGVLGSRFKPLLGLGMRWGSGEVELGLGDNKAGLH